MSKTVRHIVVVVAALASLAFSSASEAQTKLRWKFTPGQSSTYKQAVKVDSSSAAGGMVMNQLMGVTWKVSKVDETGKGELAQVIDSIRVEMNLPTANIVYDSVKGEKPEGAIGQLLTPVFDAMVGAEFGFKVSPIGEVSDVVLSEKLKKAFQASPILAQMGGMFSEDGMKRLISQSFLSFPEKGLSNGMGWNKEVTMKMPFGTQSVDTNYTYLGPAMADGKPLEKIGIFPKVAIKADPNSPTKIEIAAQKAEGEMLFDNVLGRIHRLTLKQEMQMDIAVAGQQLQQKVLTETTLELAKPETK